MSKFKTFAAGFLAGGFMVWWMMIKPPLQFPQPERPRPVQTRIEAPLKGLQEVPPTLVDDISGFVAYWEDKPLYLGLVTSTRGRFHGIDPETAAKNCDARPDGCYEGVTIGFGYNLAAPNAVRFMDDLVPIVGRERANAMLPCVGWVGLAAKQKCHDSDALMLTRDEAFSLLKVRLQRDLNAVLYKAAQEGVALTEGQIVALVCLHYNSPALVQEAPKLWAALRAGDIAEARYEITHNSGSQRDSSLQSRRDAEAQKFKTGYWFAWL